MAHREERAPVQQPQRMTTINGESGQVDDRHKTDANC